MVKGYADASLTMNIRQFLVSGRLRPTEQNPNPQVYAMRVFARNSVLAKSRFWKHMRLLNKIKRNVGQVLSVNEIFEKNPNHIKTYGIALKYQSRTLTHNCYKEFRDVTLNGAISQLFMEMAGNHRTDPNTIQIIRTATINNTEDIRRNKSLAYRSSSLKFPTLKNLKRPTEKRFRSTFKANRPNTFI